MARIYATAAEYATYSGQTAPADVDRQLRRASEVVDDVLLAAVYDVDAAGMPTASDVVGALSDAACAQVEYWAAVGEDVDTAGPVQAVSIGSVSLTYGAGADRAGPSRVAPRAVRHLARAGLLADRPLLCDDR